MSLSSPPANTHSRRKRGKGKGTSVFINYACGCQMDSLGLLRTRCPVADEIHRAGSYALKQHARTTGNDAVDWFRAAAAYALDLHNHTKEQVQL